MKKEQTEQTEQTEQNLRLLMLDLGVDVNALKLDYNRKYISVWFISGTENLKKLQKIVFEYGIKSLHVSFRSTDVDEDFFKKMHSLKVLDVKNVHISSLELPNLEWLYLNNNTSDTLNLDGCKNLKSLDCSSNQLTQLKIDGCKNLEHLNIACNQLTSLNLDGCDKLYELNCSSNQLTQLKINCKNLEKLDCSNNKLTQLNIDACGKLWKLFFQKNYLKNVNLDFIFSIENTLEDFEFDGNLFNRNLYNILKKWRRNLLVDLYYY